MFVYLGDLDYFSVMFEKIESVMVGIDGNRCKG